MAPRTDNKSRRKEIIEVAARVFAAKGFASATVRDIADEVGMLSGSLYYHFTSKDAMLEEILRDSFADLFGRYSGLRDLEGDPAQTLRLMIQVGVASMVESPDAARIMYNEFEYVQAAGTFPALVEQYKAIQDVWLDVIVRGQKTGVFRKDIDSDLAYRSIMGTILLTARWFSPAGEHTKDHVGDTFSKLFLQGLESGGG